MSTSMKALVASTLLAMASAQGVILKAQGKGAASLPFQVNTKQADANIISTKEITDNVVNECGRTILGGNIDIGENTENQLAAKTVTQVTKGSTVDIQIAQVSQDGAGPYTCDLDQTSNANAASGQTKLQIQEAQPQNGIINLKVQLPQDMACVGASTGDVCTIRCFNAAAAGPFGGCVAIQQTDTTPKQNTPQNIATAQDLEGVLKKVQKNTADLPAAFKANAEAKSQSEQGALAIKELLGNNATLEAAGPAGNANTGNNNGGGNNNNGNGNGKNNGKNNNNNGNANGNGGATRGGGAAKAGKNNGANAGTGNGNANTGNANANNGNANGGATQGGGAAKAGKNTNANNNAANGNNGANGNANAQTGGNGGNGGNGRGRNQNNNNNKRDLARSFVARRNLAPQN
ncbi:GEgh16 protein [Colletotrichum karsti]|uniref:GEgh16 protein n=1 Tax=Colletotrichum karsti TaxID=1095194 RepID=A0A9P6LNG7_9PEZI|nr:GEgh16 protein [Colletotrichum karsti]KAF9879181.1 GEgh16 protein [Colletotrichum karsti]